MSVAPHIRVLREKIGHDALLLPAVTALVFDLPGNVIDIPMRSAVFTKGKQEVRIAGGGLPAGAYFLRLSPSTGDVRTIRLHHE